MGVLYVVLPVGDEVRDYLATLGINCPPGDSRNPTPSEIRHAIQALPAVRCDFEERDGKLVRVTVEQPTTDLWATLNVATYVDELTPVEISFSKGWPPLMLSILAECVPMTGTLIVVPDTGESPIVVTPGCDVPTLMSVWETEESS